jgi:iron complex outermembrane recepter protein
MSPRVSQRILGAVSVLALLSPLSPANAQTATADTADSAAGGGLTEVVVTATRREERLQDVPISLTAFSQEKLDQQGLRNIDDLTRLSPGVTFQRNGNGSSANYNDESSDISIRGIDSQAGTSTTGIYIDDTPIQSRHIGFGAVNVFFPSCSTSTAWRSCADLKARCSAQAPKAARSASSVPSLL